MKKIFFCILYACLSFSLLAQVDDVSNEYAATITTTDLHDYLSILASDALEGRETGERGQKMAAAFIADHFQKLGLQGPVKGGDNRGFLQTVNLYSLVPGDIYVSLNKEKHENFKDIVFFGQSTTDGEVTQNIVFAGAGTAEDFDKVNVKDKAVLVMVKGTRAWREPAKLAEENGAKMLFAVNSETDEEFTSLAGRLEHYLSSGRLAVKKPEPGKEGAGVIFVKPSLAGAIFGTSMDKLKSATNVKNIKPSKITYSIKMDIKPTYSENVLGYLEGTDLKDQLVVVTAHYDHIGKNGDEINNGADDDGSGTSSVMEIAQAFAQAKKDGHGPRRSMLFMTVTGEEKGLLGSEYYTSNPVFPLENTVVDLNIDMIGRVDPKHENNPNYVYLVGSDRLSTELHQISEKVNDTYSHFDLDYTYNDENHPDRIYYRSDHWNFAKNNIPIIFYFNGVHADYHQPTDTVDKINFELLAKRAQLVFHTAWVLANRDHRLVVDKLQDQEVGSK